MAERHSWNDSALCDAASLRVNDDLKIIKAKDEIPIVYLTSQGHLSIEGSQLAV
jgi:hypothetical protein